MRRRGMISAFGKPTNIERLLVNLVAGSLSRVRPGLLPATAGTRDKVVLRLVVGFEMSTQKRPCQWAGQFPIPIHVIKLWELRVDNFNLILVQGVDKAAGVLDRHNRILGAVKHQEWHSVLVDMGKHRIVAIRFRCFFGRASEEYRLPSSLSGIRWRNRRVGFAD